MKYRKTTIEKPCELDPYGGEVCLPSDDLPGGDIIINWSGRGGAQRNYFRKMEKRLSGFDFQRVSKEEADFVIATKGRKAAKNALIDYLVEDGCCEQYTVFQQNDWLDGATELGILILNDLSGAPGAPK